MSWWDIGDDVIGDGPADVISDALGQMVSQYEIKFYRKPSLQDVLENFVLALRDIDVVNRYSFKGIVATMNKSAHTVAAKGNNVDCLDLSRLSSAFSNIEVQYQERFGRFPKLTELLQTLLFILGNSSEELLSDMHGAEIEQILVDEQ